jgi:glycerol uptake facilitator-like aquaporin
MSNNQVKQRKTAAAAAASNNGSYESIEAKTTNELLFRTNPEPQFTTMTRITGKHASGSRRELVYNFFMEFVSTFLLCMIVPIVAFTAGPTTSLVTGVLFGVVYGAAYYAVCMLPRDYKLRCHANPAVTLAYLFTGDVGIFGLLYYWFAQVIAAMLSGLVVGAILSNQDGGCMISTGCVILRATVPLPVHTNGAHGLGVSETTVICMEIFVPAILTMILLVSEYLNTPEQTEKDVIRNYHSAIRNFSIALAAFVAVGYPFQIFSFNGATYLSGLFSGALVDTATHYGRSWSVLAYLPGTLFLTNSVWNGNPGTAALYFLGPLAGAVAGGILARVAMAAGFLGGSGGYVSILGEKFTRSRYSKDAEWRNGVPRLFNGMMNSQMEEPLLHAAQTTHTSVADLINPYQAGGVSKSVL